MGKVVIDLSEEQLFDCDSFTIDKKINFLFGKNGTGKSTLASMIEDQVSEYDVSVFKGFEDLIGEEKRLNAVIIGEENVEIDKEIKEIEKQIDTLCKQKQEIENETLESAERPKNLWAKVSARKNDFEVQNKKIDAFFTDSARNIKNITNPQIADPQYNKNDFKDEIPKAIVLSEEEIQLNRELAKLDPKKAQPLYYKNPDFQTLLNETNDLLEHKVIAREVVSEIENDSQKRNFAETGLKLHRPGERCSFCGNIISAERYEKIERYFSADEIQNFRNELQNQINILEQIIDQTDALELKADNFNPQQAIEVENLEQDFLIAKKDILDFLKELNKSLNQKLKDLFEKTAKINLEIPGSLMKWVNRYNQIVDDNNSTNLDEDQQKAKNKLRYNEIQNLLAKFVYNEEAEKLNQCEVDYKAVSQLLREKTMK